MNKWIAMLYAATLLGAGAASAMDNMKEGCPGMHMKGMSMKMMDTNKDGLISETEFMDHHKMMWTKTKKNKDGLVPVEDMHMKGMGTMQHDSKGTMEPMHK
jgi:hypothetical protein